MCIYFCYLLFIVLFFFFFSSQVSELTDGVKVYNLSAGKSLPEWLEEARSKSLRYNSGAWLKSSLLVLIKVLV